MYLDEFNNDDLVVELENWNGDEPALKAELTRVQELQRQNALTGVDLTYWYEREEILEAAIA
jgi:hypothetical protein